MKASRRRDDNDDDDKKRKTTSLKTMSLKSNTYRSSSSTSRAGSKSGFKAECLQTRCDSSSSSSRTGSTGSKSGSSGASGSSGGRTGSTAQWSAKMSGNAHEEASDDSTFVFWCAGSPTANEPADILTGSIEEGTSSSRRSSNFFPIEEAVKQNLQGEVHVAPAPSNGPERSTGTCTNDSTIDLSVEDAHGVSGLTDYWGSKSKNKAAGNKHEKARESGSAWWDGIVGQMSSMGSQSQQSPLYI